MSERCGIAISCPLELMQFVTSNMKRSALHTSLFMHLKREYVVRGQQYVSHQPFCEEWSCNSTTPFLLSNAITTGITNEIEFRYIALFSCVELYLDNLVQTLNEAW